MGASRKQKKVPVAHTQPAAGPGLDHWAIVLAGVGIVVAAFAAYFNSFAGPFTFDDIQSIPDNVAIRHLWTALAPQHLAVTGGRPVLNFSFAVNYAMSGTDVGSYHALNLLV